MTQAAPQRSRPAVPVTIGRSRARRDQLICAALAVVCMAGVFLIQPAITAQRSGTTDANGKVKVPGLIPASESSVRQISVDFPRLTLGGFRGFLAMYLWDRSETAKNERRWQELGTLYNVIAKIEPYFVSVYIFNAWNGAYNLSAQWHSIDMKYRWVLKGLDHLYEGEYYNPNSGDILNEISQMYFMKLGTSYERIQYRELWRDNIAHQYEIPTDSTGATIVEAGSGGDKYDVHRQVRSFILREQFRVELAADPDKKDSRKGHGIIAYGLLPLPKGAEDPGVPFYDGVSPFFFSYREYERAVKNGRFTTGNPMIIAAYPAMSLRLWCRDDAYHATELVRRVFLGKGIEDPPTITPAEGPAAPAEPPAAVTYDYSTPAGRAAFDQKAREIRRCYDNIETIAGPKALAAFEEYQIAYPANYRSVHRKHAMEVQFDMAIARAERELFEGLVRWHTDVRTKPALSDDARSHLIKSLALYDAAIASIQTYVDTIYPIPPGGTPNPDRDDFLKFSEACRQRQDGIRKWLNLEKEKSPNLSFLTPSTIER